LNVAGLGWTITFDRVRGYITEWKGDETILEADKTTRAAIFPCFWRAPTDNDKDGAVKKWKEYGVHRMVSQLRSFRFQTCPDTKDVVVTVQTYMAPPVLGWGYHIRAEYRISTNGHLSIKMDMDPTGAVPNDIPRLGINIRLPKRLDQASWFGLGPGEAYPDKKLAQRIGIWTSTVDNLETPYDVPQENGNRMETRWVRLEGQNGGGVKVSRRDVNTFSWTGGRLTPESIERASHPCDLVREEATLLNLSPLVAGVGSAACGPGVKEDYLVKVKPTTFEFLLETV
jgi:beta-galactosidase